MSLGTKVRNVFSTVSGQLPLRKIAPRFLLGLGLGLALELRLGVGAIFLGGNCHRTIQNLVPKLLKSSTLNLWQGSECHSEANRSLSLVQLWLITFLSKLL